MQLFQTSGLCPEAQTLVELTIDKSTFRDHVSLREDVDLAAILTQHPHLIVGLNEYTRWRDEHMRYVQKDRKKKPVGHGMRGILKGLKPRK